MKFKNIHFIINPAVGKEEPILSYLNKTFIDTGIEWDVSITKKDGDAREIATRLIGKTDVIAIYGGDGGVMEVAQALFLKETPMAIIPGGTANVMAKELGIPQETLLAIELLKSEHAQILSVDMGTVNDFPFLIRINLGIMADMVLQADRDLKNSLGQLAYGITTFQTLTKSETINYKLNIDGKEIEQEGVALTVTNCGNIGIEGYSFLPDIDVSDGLLDVILMNDAGLMSVLRIAGSTLMQTESEVLKHWKCKEVTITLAKKQTFICDDCEKEGKIIYVKVVPKALKIVYPGK